VLDDEHDRLKPGAVGIEQAVIQNRFPGGANGLNLLQATEPAAIMTRIGFFAVSFMKI